MSIGLYRAWIGHRADPTSGFTFYLCPDHPDEPWSQVHQMLAAMSKFDTAWLFAPTNDDEPMFIACRSEAAPMVIAGTFLTGLPPVSLGLPQ